MVPACSANVGIVTLDVGACGASISVVCIAVWPTNFLSMAPPLMHRNAQIIMKIIIIIFNNE